MNATVTRVELTMQELHKHIKQYQIRNPSIEDGAVVLEMAIAERWPGMPVNDVLRQAEINWLMMDRRNMARDSARNINEWVDTRVQGDMFNDMPVSVPKWVLKDGDAVEYWKCSPVELLEYLRARKQAMQAEENALREAATEKARQVARVATEIEHTQAVIARAHAEGMDPAALRYAKNG